MKVTGPDWPSTRALREALREVEGREIHWGGGGKNGLEQLQAFMEADVPCPLFTTSLEGAKEFVREGKEVWGRKLHHSQGTDIVGVGHPRWKRSDYWVVKIPVSREFRQHVVDGRAIRRGMKVQVGEETRKLEVRSRRNNWHISYGEFEAPAGLRGVAKRAVEALGYTFGAVDVVEGGDGRLYVLEVNSAPATTDVGTLKAYVEAFKRRGRR
jgi:hypothetical protein